VLGSGHGPRCCLSSSGLPLDSVGEQPDFPALSLLLLGRPPPPREPIRLLQLTSTDSATAAAALRLCNFLLRFHGPSHIPSSASTWQSGLGLLAFALYPLPLSPFFVFFEPFCRGPLAGIQRPLRSRPRNPPRPLPFPLPPQSALRAPHGLRWARMKGDAPPQIKSLPFLSSRVRDLDVSGSACSGTSSLGFAPASLPEGAGSLTSALRALPQVDWKC
jgi:hypothetical protein